VHRPRRTRLGPGRGRQRLRRRLRGGLGPRRRPVRVGLFQRHGFLWRANPDQRGRHRRVRGPLRRDRHFGVGGALRGAPATTPAWRRARAEPCTWAGTSTARPSSGRSR
jgi:hypothetical protein